MEDLIRKYLGKGEEVGSRYTLRYPSRALQGHAGHQLNNRVGSSLEFKEHREYQTGDDLRCIDWNAYARSDKYIIKLYREEVSPHLDLVLDGSRSMALEDSAKMEASVGLTAVLATAAENAGYSHGVWKTGDGCQPVMNGASRPSLWSSVELNSEKTPLEAFEQMPPLWSPQGVRIFVSDLLWLGDPMQVLSRLADRANFVVVVQVLGRQDLTPLERGSFRLLDSETNEFFELYIDDAAAARYQKNFERHQDNWNQACRQVGANMVTLIAEDLISDWSLKAFIDQEILQIS